MRKRRLIKGRYNLSTQKPILANNSSIKKIAIDNSKLPQSITKPKGIYQPNNVIDDPTTISLTVNIPRDVTTEDSKLL